VKPWLVNPQKVLAAVRVWAVEERKRQAALSGDAVRDDHHSKLVKAVDKYESLICNPETRSKTL
jgi:hypothetical protein